MLDLEMRQGRSTGECTLKGNVWAALIRINKSSPKESSEGTIFIKQLMKALKVIYTYK